MLVLLFCLLYVLYSLSTFSLYCPLCSHSWKDSVLHIIHSLLNSNTSAFYFYTKVKFDSDIVVLFPENSSLFLFPSLILLSFLLNLLSRKLVSFSWSLSSCMLRSFLKNVSWLYRTLFLKRRSPLGLGGAVLLFVLQCSNRPWVSWLLFTAPWEGRDSLVLAVFF